MNPYVFTNNCRGMEYQSKFHTAKTLKSLWAFVNLVLITEQLIKRCEDAGNANFSMSALELSELVLKFTNTAGEAAMTAHTMRMLLGKWRAVFDTNEKTMLNVVAKEADRLAILLGILTTSLALIDAYQAYEEGETGLVIEKVFEAAGASLSTLGFVMANAGELAASGAFRGLATATLARMAATAWVPGVGQILVVGGAVITACLIAKEFIYPYVEKKR